MADYIFMSSAMKLTLFVETVPKARETAWVMTPFSKLNKRVRPIFSQRRVQRLLSGQSSQRQLPRVDNTRTVKATCPPAQLLMLPLYQRATALLGPRWSPTIRPLLLTLLLQVPTPLIYPFQRQRTK